MKNIPSKAFIQASVSEWIRQDKHCVVISIKVLVARQDIHIWRVSFKLDKGTWILPAYRLDNSPINILLINI